MLHKVFAKNYLVKSERFVLLPFAVEPAVDRGKFPDFVHFPVILLGQTHHVLKIRSTLQYSSLVCDGFREHST